MLKFKFLLISLFFLTLCLVAIQFRYGFIIYPSQMVAIDPDCRCHTDLEDPLEQPLRYTKGQFSGSCINSCKYRIPEVLEFEENTLYASNLFHGGQFWTAKIPLDSIKSVDIVFETFSPGINHVSMLFNFNQKKQVLLTDPVLSRRSKSVSVDSLIVSPEAAPPLEKKYTLLDGFLGRYALLNRLISAIEYRQMTEELDHPVRTYQTHLSPQEAQVLLTVSLRDGNNIFNHPYQLLFNNCATSVIDYVLDAKKILRSKNWDVWDVLDPMRGIPATAPVGTIRTLQWWDIIDVAQSSHHHSNNKK